MNKPRRPIRNPSSSSINGFFSVPKLPVSKPEPNEAPVKTSPLVKKDLRPSQSTRNINLSLSKNSLSRSTIVMSPLLLSGPISNEIAKESCSNMLTAYEMKEIENFPEIFYLGEMSTKIHPRANIPISNVFDDSSHHLKAVPSSHLAYRYEVQSVIGKGAFSQVLRCFDHKTKEYVAVKILINTDEVKEQGNFELSILKHLNSSPDSEFNCISHCLDSFEFRNHICIVFDVLGSNLYEFHKSIKFRPFVSKQLQAIATQVLTALAFCHSHNVVHCDIKPENIVFSGDSYLMCELIDFGSSCFIGQERFEYVQSRFYRAPEVILGCRYGPPIDIWSFACVLVELSTGKALFPGQTEEDMISLMAEALGTPPKSLTDSGKRKIQITQKQNKTSAYEILMKNPDTQMVDLILKCLEWVPSNRISAEDALKHPWLSC